MSRVTRTSSGHVDAGAFRWLDNGVQLPIDAAAAETFDAALMAAMSRSWPDIVYSKPSIVSAGMAPPDHLPT